MQHKINRHAPMRWLYATLFILLLSGVLPLASQEYGYAGMEENEKLILAAYQGDTVAVKQLIQQGARINAITYEGVTPLMYAAQNGHTDMVALLLRYGANVGMKPDNGYTALISAIRNGHFETAEYLVRNGADINQQDNGQVTPLMHAIAVDSFYMPDMLIYYNAGVNFRNRHGRSALMLASYLGRNEIVKELVEAGADVNAVDDQRWTPLHYATLTDQTAVIDLLVMNGASLETATSSGYTPLSLATALNRFSTARQLIGYGAAVNTRISPSLNPLTLARENKNDSLEAMLINQGARPILLPYFNQFVLGTCYRWNTDDQHLGFSFGISDQKYNLMADFGYGFRTKSIQVLEATSEGEYHQYWEGRHFVSISLEKAFYIPATIGSLKPGFFLGFSEVLTFGGYRGSGNAPDVRLLFNPKIGGILDFRFLRCKFDYAFMNQHLTDVKREWLTFSLEFLFRRNRGNIRTPSFDLI
jgi:ankyrin repeat protein